MDHIKTMSDSVALAEEDRRFAMDAGRRISGCIRIELSGGKGLTAVSVDNIRFFPRGEYVYKLLFAGSGQDKQHYHIAGNISLSAYGRGEASFCINAADLDGTGTGLPDLSTVLVAAMSTVNPDEALHPVLKGILPSSSEGSAEDDRTITGGITATKETQEGAAASLSHGSTATARGGHDPQNNGSGVKSASSQSSRPDARREQTADITAASASVQSPAGAPPSHGSPAAPRGGHSLQENMQPVSGDAQQQIYRQRQNTHTVPPGQSSIPAGTGEPVRSPRVEAFYNRNNGTAETGSSADAKTADSGRDISTPDNAAPAASPATGRTGRQTHATADSQSDMSSPSGHSRGSAGQPATGRSADTTTGDARATGSAETSPPPDRDCSSFYARSVLEKCTDLAENCSAAQDIVPFDRNFADASWKKIADTSLFPLMSPGSAEPMMKYGHFIFGWCGTHYLIGVPGRFLPEEQPDSGRSGFVYWQPIAGMPEESHDASLTLEERRKDIYGYWIAPVNRSTGHIEEMPLIEN